MSGGNSSLSPCDWTSVVIFKPGETQSMNKMMDALCDVYEQLCMNETLALRVRRERPRAMGEERSHETGGG